MLLWSLLYIRADVWVKGECRLGSAADGFGDTRVMEVSHESPRNRQGFGSCGRQGGRCIVGGEASELEVRLQSGR